MYQGQTVFSQVMDFLPHKKFSQCVDRYSGNYRVRSFTGLPMIQQENRLARVWSNGSWQRIPPP